MAKLALVPILIFSLQCVAQERGQPCNLRDTGKRGLCVRVNVCKNTQMQSRYKGKIQTCEPDGDHPVVCCPLSKSEFKCLTYYKPRYTMHHIAGGMKSRAKEFPHMAAVGFGAVTAIQWFCGGSLVSENYVLTAAHCTSTRDYGAAKWVRLGDLNLEDTDDDAEPQEFTIVQIINHPDYKKGVHYHDIALLKLDRSAMFTPYVKPVCLQINKNIPSQLVITGWGKTDILGSSSEHLLKASVSKVDHTTCKKGYSTVSKNKLPNGIVDDFQICAGDREGKDTCPGDSGGPLQYSAQANPNFFRIVGITSFGKGCGFRDSMGVYTRVSSYVRWIEDIVWPETWP